MRVKRSFIRDFLSITSLKTSGGMHESIHFFQCYVNIKFHKYSFPNLVLLQYSNIVFSSFTIGWMHIEMNVGFFVSFLYFVQ